jgi:hypothetical protein
MLDRSLRPSSLKAYEEKRSVCGLTSVGRPSTAAADRRPESVVSVRSVILLSRVEDPEGSEEIASAGAPWTTSAQGQI